MNKIDNLQRSIIFAKGKTFAFASLLFPAKIKKSVYSLYAFSRLLDDLVDNLPYDEKSILSFYDGVEMDLRTLKSENPLIQSFIDLMIEYKIPLEFPLALISSLRMDVNVRAYQTFDDLKSYMYGVSFSIGVMMAYILNVDPMYLRYAGELGDSMQLTNILRDVGEDLDRGRVYIPQSYLDSIGYSKEDLQNRVYNDKLILLYQTLIKKNRQMYIEANSYISKIPSLRARIAVRTASYSYEKILDKIEKEQYNVLSKRVSTSALDKLTSLFSVIFLLQQK